MNGENKGGRPPYNYALMFEIVILQRYYNLGDDSTERVRHFGPVVVYYSQSLRFRDSCALSTQKLSPLNCS
ncbi:MAG: transposase [Cytophagales bacterium]|nr:transposase [Cytophagales bacterium]MCA6369789.1 transposase [Cytophagales bacterium]MCA6377428.1 transposase [Cytophagales bacterium]MCA6384992.1 transposase [Cytophagales bacterium]